MRRFLPLLFLFAGLGFIANAQEFTLTGQVTSVDDDQGLPGVSILIMGTTSGTVTDIDGNYTLQLFGF